MKKFLSSFLILTLTIVGLSKNSVPAFADANNFYFSSGVFDYYLSRTEEGYSRVEVKESLTAVFPNYAQNHGIERCIPTYYKYVKSLEKSSFSVTMDGHDVPFSSYTDKSFTCFRIGDADSYVTGSHTYDISFVLNNMIFKPNDSENQELYLDTNGTGWSQKFLSIVANVHIPDYLISARGENRELADCYVGTYGTSGVAATSRCEIFSNLDDSGDEISFLATNLGPGETLTLNLAFLDGTFNIASPGLNSPLFILGAITFAILVLIIIYWRKSETKIKDKKKLAKDKVVPVQYVPPKGLTVAESGNVWLKSSKSLQVATLMELAVAHKVELEKGEKKRFGGYHWKIHVKHTENLSTEQTIILEILNGGSSVHDGDIIEVKRHSTTSHLEKLGRDFSTKVEGNLRGKQLFETEEKSSKKTLQSIGTILVVMAVMFAFPFAIKTFVDLAEYALSDNNPVVIFSGLACVIISVLSVISFITISVQTSKYKKRTLKGIEVSKYLDGLKEYMTLAEKDRLKFLQSVKGVDTSHEGIVRLYEKLLPYAVIFGIEDSWLSELNKYYEYDDVSDHTWLVGASLLSVSDFHSFTSYTSSSVYSSTASSSSGSSGGGGGGFSGGGGGGGGGGGW